MEEVLVVERAALEALLPGEGFWTEAIEPVRRFVQEHHYFLPRDQAEYDATAKQIIPYVVVRQAGRYFLLRRKRKQTEARLHDKSTPRRRPRAIPSPPGCCGSWRRRSPSSGSCRCAVWACSMRTTAA